MAVHQYQCATVNPLQRDMENNRTAELRNISINSQLDRATLLTLMGRLITLHRVCVATYTEADYVTAEMKLSLFDHMDGPCLLLLHLKQYKNKKTQYILECL